MEKFKKTSNEKETRFLHLGSLEVRSLEGESETQSKVVGGYVVKYNQNSEVMTDRWGDKFVEVIAENAFVKSLETKSQKALWNHNTDLVLGSVKSGTLTLFNDNIGLRCEINLPDTQAGEDAYQSIKRGDVDGMSFGFRCTNNNWDIVVINDEEVYKRTILEADLIEISPTTFAAYPDSEINCRSLESFKSEKTSKERLKEQIISRTYF